MGQNHSRIPPQKNNFCKNSFEKPPQEKPPQEKLPEEKTSSGKTSSGKTSSVGISPGITSSEKSIPCIQPSVQIIGTISSINTNFWY